MLRTVASYYSGIGGGMLGAVQAGLKPLWAADDRDFVKATHFRHTWKDYLEAINSPWEIPRFSAEIKPSALLEPPDLLAGSPPCKRFSSLAVRKKDRHVFDPRELEVIKFFNVVQLLNPKAFILENLKKLSDFIQWDPETHSVLAGKGHLLFLQHYHIKLVVLDSYDYKVPQRRKRLYWIGIRENLIEDTKLFDSREPWKVGPGTAIRAAFRDVKNRFNMEVSSHSAERIVGFAKLQPGDSYYGTQNNRRLHWDKPSPTITSHRTSYVHPSKPRTLTVRETARLMGFVDHFLFYGTRTSQFDQVGCGITPPVTTALTKYINSELPEE